MMFSPIVRQQLRHWYANYDQGASSKVIVGVMTNMLTRTDKFGNCPQDPSDLGRCIDLLNCVPSYRDNLHLMQQVSPEWARLVVRWDELETLFLQEKALGNSAPKTYDLMRQIINQKE